LILVSKSPRRSQLLREAGFDFSVVPLDVEEDFPPDMAPASVAEYLSQRKALAGKHLIHDREILLAADSTVIMDGTIFNKPSDFDEAVYMLTHLSGRTHQVVTGVTLLGREQSVSFSGLTEVTFAPLSEAEIRFYVNTYEPYDKAGSYGVQEWLGLCKIVRLDGTYANVMGLPVDLVYQHLKSFQP
jgi:septum formation protein